MYVDGRPTRLYTACFEEANRDRQELETELNQMSLGATLGLPGAALFVAAGWAGFWTLIDITFEFFRIKFVDVNILTVPLILVLLGVVGWAMGWPTGATLRRSIAIRKAPQILSLLFALLTAIAEVQITDESVTHAGYRFDFHTSRSAAVGVKSFFRTPIGRAITAGFFVTVLVIILSLFCV